MYKSQHPLLNGIKEQLSRFKTASSEASESMAEFVNAHTKLTDVQYSGIQTILTNKQIKSRMKSKRARKTRRIYR